MAVRLSVQRSRLRQSGNGGLLWRNIGPPRVEVSFEIICAISFLVLAISMLADSVVRVISVDDGLKSDIKNFNWMGMAMLPIVDEVLSSVLDFVVVKCSMDAGKKVVQKSGQINARINIAINNKHKDLTRFGNMPMSSGAMSGDGFLIS